MNTYLSTCGPEHFHEAFVFENDKNIGETKGINMQLSTCNHRQNVLKTLANRIQNHLGRGEAGWRKGGILFGIQIIADRNQYL